MHFQVGILFFLNSYKWFVYSSRKTGSAEQKENVFCMCFIPDKYEITIWTIFSGHLYSRVTKEDFH